MYTRSYHHMDSGGTDGKTLTFHWISPYLDGLDPDTRYHIDLEIDPRSPVDVQIQPWQQELRHPENRIYPNEPMRLVTVKLTPLGSRLSFTGTLPIFSESGKSISEKSVSPPARDFSAMAKTRWDSSKKSKENNWNFSGKKTESSNKSDASTSEKKPPVMKVMETEVV